MSTHIIVSLEEIERLRKISARVGSFFVPPATLEGLLGMAEEWHRISDREELRKAQERMPKGDALRALAASHPPPQEWYDE